MRGRIGDRKEWGNGKAQEQGGLSAEEGATEKKKPSSRQQTAEKRSRRRKNIRLTPDLKK